MPENGKEMAGNGDKESQKSYEMSQNGSKTPQDSCKHQKIGIMRENGLEMANYVILCIFPSIVWEDMALGS